jgi:hypothetical protein
MGADLHPIDVQVLHGRHVIGLEVAAMNDQHIVVRARELLDNRASDKARPA